MKGANTPIHDIQTNGDWMAAFETAVNGCYIGGFKPIQMLKDIVRVVCCDPGENDEDNWIGVFELSNGQFVWISAGCDYTGWGCQEWGEHALHATESEALARLPAEEARRMGVYTHDCFNTR